ncbi:c-type cytochrome [Chitinophaga nivalis]|uniref:C-type cytochrome n=1 Tax=Chitinophaga nivalis TaxID=2991709 RepID=A0ABT3IVQ3_9BACT|nr:c-type cytochrome [Chitinophaga nivalis]MCW3462250.1 c-type cytochrome [Chitinophaga nivalis]MCW3488058.1 c-type cytochrome [Chitinophaga nivalis]
MWQPPDSTTIPAGTAGDMIRYGHTLISETARYLGPKGSVLQLSNGMNCQNCHLEAGTKPFGNNYSRVASVYPLFRARSNSRETIYKRISDCFERSLNGTAPDSSSREMIAIKAYIEWLGSEVTKDTPPTGAGIKKVPLLARAADPKKGRLVYQQQCSSCHGAGGEGQLQPDKVAYLYPPLWGPASYNDGAGIYRLFNLAGYVKYNMPFGVDYNSARLSDEEAWDVAAYINSMPRPHKDQGGDWHDLRQKPIDFPFGPYADAFSEQQHKYGPYQHMHP